MFTMTTAAATAVDPAAQERLMQPEVLTQVIGAMANIAGTVDVLAKLTNYVICGYEEEGMNLPGVGDEVREAVRSNPQVASNAAEVMSVLFSVSNSLSRHQEFIECYLGYIFGCDDEHRKLAKHLLDLRFDIEVKG